jgi:hypothetical protein
MADENTVWLVGLENDDDQFVIIDNVVQVWFYATEEAGRRKLVSLNVPPGATPIIEETGPANQYVGATGSPTMANGLLPHVLDARFFLISRWGLDQGTGRF